MIPLIIFIILVTILVYYITRKHPVEGKWKNDKDQIELVLQDNRLMMNKVPLLIKQKEESSIETSSAEGRTLFKVENDKLVVSRPNKSIIKYIRF